MATEHSEDKKPGNGLEHGPAGDDFLNDKPTSYSDAEETAAIAAEEGHVATDKSVLVYTYHSARMDCSPSLPDLVVRFFASTRLQRANFG